MYQLSRTVPVNEPKKSFLSRHDVWTGLLMKANNALPYVPEMKKCEVVETGDGWLVRDIMLKDVPLREKVTFVPEEKVIFERTRQIELVGVPSYTSLGIWNPILLFMRELPVRVA